MVEVTLSVEAAAPTKAGLLEILEAQAAKFFGDEEYRLDGPIRCGLETYVETPTGKEALRWNGTADYVNWREQDPWLPR